VEVVYATLEVLDAAAELELVLVTTPLALEELVEDAVVEELVELELLLVVVVAAAVDEAVREYVIQEQAELTALISLSQLLKSVGMAAISVVVLARNSVQKL
jgi:hypothetical protein